MIIAVDGNEANVSTRVGIGEYSFELLKQFKEFKIPDLKFQIYLKNKPLKHMPLKSDNWQYRVIGPKKFWTQFALPFDLYLHSPKPDVFFTPSHYAPRFSPVPTVISVMDLSYIHFPELFKKTDLYQLVNWTRYSVQNARKVLTISEASKNDIIEKYSQKAQKIVVTYPGIKSMNLSQKSPNKQIKEKYILFVGTLQPRKNIQKLIEAYAQLNVVDVKLVIAGKKGWLYEDILSAPKAFNVEKNVIFLDFVTDEELANMYKNAEFFILPSLYEGFGLPVLEAMQNSCPVITSNISSLPEVGGDAALYIDPYDTNDIADKMGLLLADKKLREQLVKKGLEQVKKFSWEKTAQQTLKVLQEVANER